ncbi:3-phytase [Sphingobacterium allocomposti]|uniref:3-phytase n=1 Tax=Sphingobacterium allocomposti TaxID=415956 RepID=A0A5S5D6A7_9SPHI|nr:phytase [Sphingobacterium composti Yoo et al. 2007 non Ten et al. 2007]TYP91511.1 3-phytase [Sphingobacterium composti Yoo et al. 2007 non Ten et al. 2007]
MKKLFFWPALVLLVTSCQSGLAPVADNAIPPTLITEPTENDTDDPAIWIHPEDASKSLVIGTDKEVGGGLYVYDLEGKVVTKFLGMQRPNNVDVAYGLLINGVKTDIAVATERKTQTMRVFALPHLKPIDNGGIPIFEGEEERDGMGIALYTKQIDSASNEIHAIVGRKSGPSGSYLWQYKLQADTDGSVKAEVIRKFGAYSGKKEIEAIAVDNELGYVYYSDETAGIRKYHADPDKGNEELAFFGQHDAKRDHEGIALYKKDRETGYILVSNQQNNTFLVYKREGEENDPHAHTLIADIPLSSIECDGADATSVALGDKFPMGMFVAMSNGKVFQLYDWRLLQDWIDQNPAPEKK